jgi:hypothetical protein
MEAASGSEPLPYLRVAVETFQLRSASAQSVALRALRRAAYGTMRFRYGPRRNLRPSGARPREKEN